jgi:hypothetical protein
MLLVGRCSFCFQGKNAQSSEALWKQKGRNSAFRSAFARAVAVCGKPSPAWRCEMPREWL